MWGWNEPWVWPRCDECRCGPRTRDCHRGLVFGEGCGGIHCQVDVDSERISGIPWGHQTGRTHCVLGSQQLREGGRLGSSTRPERANGLVRDGLSGVVDDGSRSAMSDHPSSDPPEDRRDGRERPFLKAERTKSLLCARTRCAGGVQTRTAICG